MPKDADEQTKEEKTKVTIINDEKDRGKLYLPYIYKYSTIGFTIGKNKVMGSVAIFPGGILSWKVRIAKTLSSVSCLNLLETFLPAWN